MIPEIRSATKITFSPFAPFFAALLLPNNPENQNFEKKEKYILRRHQFTHVYLK